MRRRTHAAKRITAPSGDRFMIDCGIVDLIRAIWRMGIPTVYSCENSQNEDRFFQVSVPDQETAERFYFVATGTPISLAPSEFTKARVSGCPLPYQDRGWEIWFNSFQEVHCYIPIKDLPDVLHRRKGV